MHVYIWQFLICLVLKSYESTTKHTNFVMTAPHWSLMGLALMGRALMDPLGPHGPGPYGPPWALMGRALTKPLGPNGPGPNGPLNFHWCKF